jgi:hypothetical protein
MNNIVPGIVNVGCIRILSILGSGIKCREEEALLLRKFRSKRFHLLLKMEEALKC